MSEDESEPFDTAAEATLDAIEACMAEGGAEITACVGPPVCNLQGDDAIANQEAGCPLCRRIIVHRDGTQEEYRKATN